MRRTIITGYFGSGKTEIAMQMARDRSENGQKVVLVDLDVANPYYTSSAHRAALAENGVHIVVPTYANTNVDVPALTAGVRAALLDPSCDIVVDLGGDIAGATVMGSLANLLDQAKDVALLLVVNVYRPFTQTPEAIQKLMGQIESRAKMRITGLVNNANLLDETLPGHLYRGEAVLQEVSCLTAGPSRIIAAPHRCWKTVSKALRGNPCCCIRVTARFGCAVDRYPIDIQINTFNNWLGILTNHLNFIMPKDFRFFWYGFLCITCYTGGERWYIV